MALFPQIEDKNHLEYVFKKKNPSSTHFRHSILEFLEDGADNLYIEYYAKVKTNEVEICILI